MYNRLWNKLVYILNYREKEVLVQDFPMKLPFNYKEKDSEETLELT